MGFATDCIHAGQEPDPTTGAVTVPIYQTSTYVQEELGKHKGYEYARTHNLTRRTLEKNLAALEGGTDAYCYASGMAATQAVLTMVKAGQRVVVSDNVYGGTHRLFTKVLARYGVEFAFLDATDPAALEREAGEFQMLWIETPTNPLMKICDIRRLAGVAHGKGAVLVVDNTFMSPFFQRPLALGADVVVHSTTKFLNGHSDSVGGVAVVRDEAHARWLQYVQNAVGAILSPFDSWLVLRGTKTLHMRMPRHEENACEVAPFLFNHRKVERVFWPGFPEHPGHEVHKHQATGFGALVSFELGSREAAKRMLGRVRLCSLGESLGGVETLISHPATMTHAGYTPRGAAAARDHRRPRADQRRLRGRRGPRPRPRERPRRGVAAPAANLADAVGDPGEVRCVAALDREDDELGQLVRVQGDERLAQRLHLLRARLYDEEPLLVALDALLPAVDRDEPGHDVDARGEPALDERAGDALGVLGRAHGRERDDRALGLHRAPRAAIACHCSGVSGTTDRRPCRTSGLSAKEAIALISARDTWRASRPRGSTSTTTSFPVGYFGSG